MKLAVKIVGLCLLIFALFPQRGFSQAESGTISGVVSDPSGGAVPGATVTAKNLSTNARPRTRRLEL